MISPLGQAFLALGDPVVAAVFRSVVSDDVLEPYERCLAFRTQLAAQSGRWPLGPTFKEELAKEVFDHYDWFLSDIHPALQLNSV